MDQEELIEQLTAQVQALQAQFTAQAAAQAVPAPAPIHRPPKVAPPSPFSSAQDDLKHFKAECSLYLTMRQAEFLDERSRVLFVLSYMKGGAAGSWATQKVNQILNPLHPLNITLAAFTQELEAMFADPNREASARRKLATLRQGSDPVEDLIRQFKIYGPPSQLGDVGLVDRFEQAIHPRLRESIYRLQPMPTTWHEWKSKAALLDNQWRRFQATQPRSFPNRITPPRPPTTTPVLPP